MGRAGQSTIEALISVVLITSATSLMFHSAVKVFQYIIQEQDSIEKSLLELSNDKVRS